MNLVSIVMISTWKLNIFVAAPQKRKREQKQKKCGVATELQIQNIIVWHLHSHNRENAAAVFKNETNTERKWHGREKKTENF